MNRHPPLLQATWLNWSNYSLDDKYRSPLNIWNVSRSSFISSFLHCAGAPLSYGNTKGQAFWTVCAQRVHLGPRGPACPLLLFDCVSAVWSDVTLRRHYPHHCASQPLCTGNQLWQPWPSNLIGPVTPWPLAIEMVLKSTTITCRPLDYCINTLTWTQRFDLSASVPLSVFALYFLGISDLILTRMRRITLALFFFFLLHLFSVV